MSEVVSVKLTVAQKAALVARAEAAGKTPSSFVHDWIVYRRAPRARNLGQNVFRTVKLYSIAVKLLEGFQIDLSRALVAQKISLTDYVNLLVQLSRIAESLRKRPRHGD